MLLTGGHSTPLTLLLLSSQALTALGDFYVSLQGKDSAPGCADAPFATLERAQEAVRSVNSNLQGDLHVYVAPGTYYLTQPLRFTAADSGSNGHRVVWVGDSANGGVNISGGVQLTRWKLHDSAKGIWSTETPTGLRSRHFYADQRHVRRASRQLTRSWLIQTDQGYSIVDAAGKFLLTTPGIEHGEIRGIGSFTDRYAPIDHVSGEDIVMMQPAYQNNIIGYDTINKPFFDYGLYLENVLEVLDTENEYYLNTSARTIYYKPPHGVSPNSQYLVLPKLEQLLVVAGTYDQPVHDITFQAFNCMHTTWNLPSSGVGYADQQTGGFIGLNKSYTVFESSRPFWWQVPGSIQASACQHILFTNGSMSAIMGGFGIGNDANAHVSGVGLGAQDVVISGVYFTETGANSITIGGIAADAHHPTDDRMINRNNRILENVFKDTAKTITSSAAVLVTYNDGAEISRNDFSDVPYSAICYGYGWGSNDAGGSNEYAKRGLYKYQPRYSTATVQRRGLIKQNAIRDFGLTHADLGAIYTLSASPLTNISGNYILSGSNNHTGTAYYHDEGSRDYVVSDSVVNVIGNSYGGGPGSWYQRNEHGDYTTGNLTAHSVAVAAPQQPGNGNNSFGDRVYDVIQYKDANTLSSRYGDIIYNAGIPPAQRAARRQF